MSWNIGELKDRWAKRQVNWKIGELKDRWGYTQHVTTCSYILDIEFKVEICLERLSELRAWTMPWAKAGRNNPSCNEKLELDQKSRTSKQSFRRDAGMVSRRQLLLGEQKTSLQLSAKVVSWKSTCNVTIVFYITSVKFLPYPPKPGTKHLYIDPLEKCKKHICTILSLVTHILYFTTQKNLGHVKSKERDRLLIIICHCAFLLESSVDVPSMLSSVMSDRMAALSASAVNCSFQDIVFSVTGAGSVSIFSGMESWSGGQSTGIKRSFHRNFQSTF